MEKGVTTRSETHAGGLLSSRFGPVWAVLGAACLASVAILVFRGMRAGGPGETDGAQGTITVPAIPDSIRDEIPSTWSQPRNDPAGPGVWEECRMLGGCATGEAVISGGYDLPLRYVVHTVGPV